MQSISWGSYCSICTHFFEMAVIYFVLCCVAVAFPRIEVLIDIYVQWNLAITAPLVTCKTGWISEVAGSQRTSSPLVCRTRWIGPAKLVALVRWLHFN